MTRLSVTSYARTVADEDLLRWVHTIAKEEGLSVSQFVMLALQHERGRREEESVIGIGRLSAKIDQQGRLLDSIFKAVQSGVSVAPAASKSVVITPSIEMDLSSLADTFDE